MFIRSQDVVIMDYINVKNEEGNDMLIGKHPVIILSVTDEYFYFVHMSTSFFSKNGNYYKMTTHDKKGIRKEYCYVNLNWVHKHPHKNLQPFTFVPEKKFVDIVSALIECQENRDTLDPNYLEIKEELLDIVYKKGGFPKVIK
jgi:hypothetical protein